MHEDRPQRKPWQQPNYHDVALMAMEEMSAHSAHPDDARQLIQKAAQEFGQHGRGIAFDVDLVIVIGKNQGGL